MVDIRQPEALILVAAIFVLAGFVKGVVGLGLPTVSLGLLTATLGLTEAMVLMLVPSFVTNAWQAVVGGAFVAIVRRLWTLLLAACAGIWLGADLLARADVVMLSGVLGLLLCVYAAVGLAGPGLKVSRTKEPWLSPAIGAVNGVLTGLTGSFVVPGVPYLQALGLPRDVLIQAMGILFTVSTLALALALAHSRLMPGELAMVSFAGLVPAILGMLAGQWLRHRIAETRFRRVFFCALFILGGYIGVRSLL